MSVWPENRLSSAPISEEPTVLPIPSAAKMLPIIATDECSDAVSVDPARADNIYRAAAEEEDGTVRCRA